MITIKTKKSGFTLVPEGRQRVYVEKVDLLPSGKPSVVNFLFKHEKWWVYQG